MPNNLPVRLSTFIGRQSELVALGGLVLGNRLVTVTGSGGAGKTRLALQAAAEAVDRFIDGVWWVELAPLPDGGDVAAAVAMAIGVNDDGETPISQLVVRRLTRDTALIVLDNCEHVLDGATALAGALLGACPGVRILTTSRAVLDVDGEVTWRVPPLSLPSISTPESIDRLGQYDAVSLFVDRARRARPTFVLSDENGPTIADICSRLDGIPLAIELAAARTKSLSPERIRAGLDDSLRLLTSESRAVLPRQQTLEASISWSVTLLAERERVVLRRLSVFSGTFELSGAERVCGGDGVDELEVLDSLERLLDHSLIVTKDAMHDARFGVLETVRQYSSRMLDEAGEVAGRRELHARHITEWARTEAPLAETAAEFEVVARLDSERNNLRVALSWFEGHESPDRFAELICDLAPYWDQGGHFAVAIDWFTRALVLTADRDSIIRSRLLAHRAEARWALADFENVVADIGAAIEMGERVGADRAVGRALWTKAAMLGFLDLAEYRTVVDLATERLTAAGDRYAAAEIRSWRAGVLGSRGYTTDAIAVLDEAEPYVVALGNPSLLASFRTWRALGQIATGRVADGRRTICGAEAAYEGTAMVCQLIAARLQASALLELDDPGWDDLEARLSAARRDGYGLAAFAFASSLMSRRTQLGDANGVLELAADLDSAAFSLSPMLAAQSGPDVAQALILLGRTEEARARLDVTEQLARAADNPGVLCMAAWLRSVMSSDEGEVAAAESAAHESISHAWDHGSTVLVRWGLMALIHAVASAGDHAEAARLIGLLGQIDDQLGVRQRLPVLAARLEAAADAARAGLGASGYEAALAEVRAVDLDGAVDYLRRARGERRRPAFGWESLTPTELQVIDLVCQGLTNKEVGYQLLMGAETVKTHVSHVYAKLGVNNRTKLTALATERALR